MPMGLKNAPAIFQRMMDFILGAVEFADPYIDDIIIGSDGDTWEELIDNHYKDVMAVLNFWRQKTSWFPPRKSKCSWVRLNFVDMS